MESKPVNKPCRYFLTDRGCPYGGGKCRFSHEGRRGWARDGGKESRGEECHRKVGAEGSTDPTILSSFPSLTCKQPSTAKHTNSQLASGVESTQHTYSQARGRHQRSELSLGAFMVQKPQHQPVSRPQQQTLPGAGWRDIEVQQMTLRFHGDQCRLVEKGQDRSVYLIKFTPSDPAWDFPFSEVGLMVAFPKAYPSQLFSVWVSPEQQSIPARCSARVNQCIGEHLQQVAAHRREDGQLLFRPFLHWLDKHILRLLRDAFAETSEEKHIPWSGGERKGEESSGGGESGGEESGGEESGGEESGGGESGKLSLCLSQQKRGVEVRLVGLQLSEQLAAVLCPVLRLDLQCVRCHGRADLTLQQGTASSVTCSRCRGQLTAAYHPSLVHAASTTLGFLDLHGCTAGDVIMQSCKVTLTCLQCGGDTSATGLSFGDCRVTWCRSCHSKLVFVAQQCKFLAHCASAFAGDKVKATQKRQESSVKEKKLMVGNPLPNEGTCSHYKKSHRWLRFPCCGRLYPCDVCHDSAEDHPMQRAGRMLCGFCSREQVCTASGVCVGCGAALAGGRPTAHWEGGHGCRNRAKMNRHDNKKYTDSEHKTTCKKSQRVGGEKKCN